MSIVWLDTLRYTVFCIYIIWSHYDDLWLNHTTLESKQCIHCTDLHCFFSQRKGRKMTLEHDDPGMNECFLTLVKAIGIYKVWRNLSYFKPIMWYFEIPYGLIWRLDCSTKIKTLFLNIHFELYFSARSQFLKHITYWEPWAMYPFWCCSKNHLDLDGFPMWPADEMNFKSDYIGCQSYTWT